MSMSALDLHLQTGATTVARAWSITRRDGLQLGFTDHDLPLAFDGLSFLPETGMTARALTQSSGLAVDNSEALGVLSDARISEADINAGLYDGAEVTTWLVNWQDVAARKILFKGHLDEIRRSGIGSEAELRGLTEALNQPQGRVFQSQCAAVLGHAACGVDLTDPAFVSQRAIEVITDRQRLQWSNFSGYDIGWFTAGRLQVLCDRLCDCLTGLCVRVGHGRSQELIVSPPPLADGKTSLDSLRSVQFSDDYYPTRVKSSVCVCVRGARLLRNIFPSITGHGRKEEMW